MLEARLFHVLSNALEIFRMRQLFFCDVQPAEPVAFVRAGPERRILLPEARHFIVFFPILEGCRYGLREIFRQDIGLFVHAHARAPAVLPTASSKVLKASENNFTPSASSLSVTSFIEIPALARSAIVFAAPSTFSVRLGRSFP